MPHICLDTLIGILTHMGPVLGAPEQRRAINVGKISLGSISGVLWCLVVLTLYIGAKISDFIVAIVMGWGCFI